jgi:hypothetical protein
VGNQSLFDEREGTIQGGDYGLCLSTAFGFFNNVDWRCIVTPNGNRLLLAVTMHKKSAAACCGLTTAASGLIFEPSSMNPYTWAQKSAPSLHWRPSPRLATISSA